MNNPHHGARLTVYSREQIVSRVRAGQRASDVAEAFGVSLRTVRKWLARFRAGGRAALSNRASAPARVSGRLPDRLVALILHLRRSLRLTGAEIAARLGLARSTVARWLARSGMGRLDRLDPPEPVRRYQRARPGELIHLDIKKLGRFDRPGHRATGTRTGCRNRGAGWDFVHVAVDDATRLAYVEVLADERKDTATAFLLRALRWFRGHGILAERVMTDNGSAYRSRRFAKALRLLRLRHIFTRPYTPRTNGKAERFIQTLLREWAYGLAHPSSAARNADLPRWLDWFNRSRPHSALSGLPPLKRVNDLMRTHI
ncbi:IS481 family transposase [Palleronia sediminis]|uniref:IS481 family transposase n=1 Tax=Palleronia sediminis TaxID=2547833 RepID=A0A4R6A0D7_9RHOB|nr:IS481 family transposase [Palleronia sediminis]TDL76012.1 IS481 family transposase [Palleronia sediminis]